ncbi:MAG: YciI family protein [Gammaproteobacteria bacterium]|nr:MAG: YciI family protein [Gammaproteobacteria bacterium]
MYYSIVAIDNKDSFEKRKQVREKHLARLELLKNEGRLLIAGPNPQVESEQPQEHGFSGSIIIAKFNSLNDAQNWADADPYIQAGVYANVMVKPFIKVLP